MTNALIRGVNLILKLCKVLSNKKQLTGSTSNQLYQSKQKDGCNPPLGQQPSCFSSGGVAGIWTLAGLTPPNDLANRPLQPLEYHSISIIIIELAERVGFEPTVPFGITGFQDQLHKPLGHLSITGTDYIIAIVGSVVNVTLRYCRYFPGNTTLRSFTLQNWYPDLPLQPRAKQLNQVLLTNSLLRLIVIL